jgi:hypothetical protein
MATRDRGSLGPGEALRHTTSIRQIIEQPMIEGEHPLTDSSIAYFTPSPSHGSDN